MSSSSSAPTAASGSFTPPPWSSTSALVGRWGGRLSYTWSSTKDNQFGQDNTYLTRTAIPQNNYDLDAEYGVSNFDSPHRIILAPIFRFPDGGNVADAAAGTPRRSSSSSAARR